MFNAIKRIHLLHVCITLHSNYISSRIPRESNPWRWRCKLNNLLFVHLHTTVSKQVLVAKTFCNSVWSRNNFPLKYYVNCSLLSLYSPRAGSRGTSRPSQTSAPWSPRTPAGCYAWSSSPRGSETCQPCSWCTCQSHNGAATQTGKEISH